MKFLQKLNPFYWLQLELEVKDLRQQVFMLSEEILANVPETQKQVTEKDSCIKSLELEIRFLKLENTEQNKLIETLNKRLADKTNRIEELTKALSEAGDKYDFLFKTLTGFSRNECILLNKSLWGSKLELVEFEEDKENAKFI